MTKQELEFKFNLEVKFDGKLAREINASGKFTATEFKGLIVEALHGLGEGLQSIQVEEPVVRRKPASKRKRRGDWPETK